MSPNQMFLSSKWCTCILLLFSFAANAQTPFTNATPQLPLIDGEQAYGPLPVAVVDMNGDGLDDIVRLHNGNKLTITTQTSLGFTNLLSVTLPFFPWSIAAADIDQDGLMDLYVGGRDNKVALLYGQDNYAVQSPPYLPTGGISPLFFSQGANFADIDGDGQLDLFACGDTTQNLTWQGQSNGSISLVDLIPQSNPGTNPSNHGGNYGSVWFDFDGDGDLDLYLSKCLAMASVNDIRRRNMLLIQTSPGVFQNQAISFDLDDTDQNWAIDFGDLNNDGNLEAVTISHDGPDSHGIARLLVKQPDGKYDKVFSANSGISYISNGAQVLLRDFDNDGLLDVLLAGQSSRLYRNLGNLTFEYWTSFDLPQDINMGTFAVGDLNHDGYLDIYGGYVQFIFGGGVNNGADSNRPDQLWLNNLTNNGNHYLGVQLEGVAGNEQAIGARVWVDHQNSTKEAESVQGANALQPTTQFRDVKSGESYGIMNSYQQHFGLGSNPADIDVTVSWPASPNQTLDQTLYDIAPDQVIRIRQGVAPDLTAPLNAVSIDPTQLNAGSGTTVSFDLQNLTGTHAGYTKLAVVLSSDDTYQASDVTLKTVTMDNVPAEDQIEREVEVTIPNGTASGTYYLLLRVDVADDLAEDNETNNLTAFQIQVGISQADLVIQNANLNPASVVAGNTVQATANVVNQGAMAAGTSRLAYYLSNDTTFDGSDLLLDDFSVPQLGVNGTTPASKTLTIPSNQSGTRYILFRADAGNTVAEGPGEANNVVPVQIQIVSGSSSVDLIVENATGSPNALQAGEQIYTTSRVKNQGTLYASNSVMGIFYSNDANWNPQTDTLLFSRTVGGLNPGGTSYDPEYVTIPASAQPGTRYLLFVADMNNDHPESNESNNVNALAFTVIDPASLPDLITQNPSLSHSSVKPNDYFWTNIRTKNQGIPASLAPPSRTEVWLSQNATLETNIDTRLASTSTDSLTGGDYDDLSILVRMPAATTAGAYTLIFVADGPGSIDETNETNNQTTIGITVDPPTNFPDYIVTETGLGASTVSAGSSVGTTCRLRNVGTGTTTPSKFKYYLSNDATYDASDVLLRTVNVGDIGFPPQFGYTITIPAGTSPGTKYVLFFTDAENDILENSETNNVEAEAITVQ